MLKRDFYLRDGNIVARDLLGKILVHNTPEGRFSGMIVETEAYLGMNDLASHAANRKLTDRTRIQFGMGGYSYVYLIYGMHYCFNIVTNIMDRPEAVLIRALQPVDGIEEMLKKRKCKRVEDTCNGPGKLCTALNITNEEYGKDLCGSDLFLEDGNVYLKEEIGVSPRINIDYAGESKDLLWRYYVKNNKYVSKVHKSYASDLTLADL